MRKIYLFITLFIATLIILPYYTEYIILAEDQTSIQENPVIDNLNTIKKKHDNDYNSGIYNNNKKDYVKGWIDEDIDYHKKVIKLKSDYREWALNKISKGETVNFNEYISLKSYSKTEKEILLDYHNKHFNKLFKK